MNTVSEFESESLQALFWRDEIPEAMYWLCNEGLGENVDPELLDRFLWVDTEVDAQRLDSLVATGLLRRTPEGRYQLTEAGRSHGAALFADDFPETEAAPLDSACACGCCGEEPEGETAPLGCACGCCGGEREAETVPAPPLASRS